MPLERRIVSIADDLTGALEVGAKFAGAGVPASVVTEFGSVRSPEATVLVVDTETRHLLSPAAAALVRCAGENLRCLDPWLVYKKTDSTLRGHIAEELRALRGVFPERELVYVPAYPDMGRTVRSGRLFIRGVPVHQTEFAHDALNPVTGSDIAAMLRDVGATIVDGESNADVLKSARDIAASSKRMLVAGPAAIAGALAESVCPSPAIMTLPRLQRCIVVNGSMHPNSAAQVAFAEAQGCFDSGWTRFEYKGSESGVERAARTGEQVAEMLRNASVDAIIVFGGDTAYGIHRALGSQRFESYGEVAAGVPLSHSAGLFWVTKAGGFGGGDILCEIRRKLT